MVQRGQEALGTSAAPEFTELKRESDEKVTFNMGAATTSAGIVKNVDRLISSVSFSSLHETAQI